MKRPDAVVRLNKDLSYTTSKCHETSSRPYRTWRIFYVQRRVGSCSRSVVVSRSVGQPVACGSGTERNVRTSYSEP